MGSVNHWRPQGFRLCSNAYCLELFAQGQSIDPDRALPVSPHAWQQLHQRNLAAPAVASCGQPWWLHLQSNVDSSPDTKADTKREAVADLHSALFYVAPQLACFDGHFPGQPLLPGVVQIEWAMALADNLWPQALAAQKFAGMSRVKFKAPIKPKAVLAMELKLTGSAQGNGAALTIKSADQILTSAQLIYRD